MINKIEITRVTAADLAIIEPLVYACDTYHYEQLAHKFKTPEQIASQQTPQSFHELMSGGNCHAYRKNQYANLWSYCRKYHQSRIIYTLQ
ncbi:MAG: hypothetical protein ACI9ES_000429 [Oceanospirillaceae bacterium]|jgi:hypothetical protein